MSWNVVAFEVQRGSASPSEKICFLGGWESPPPHHPPTPWGLRAELVVKLTRDQDRNQRGTRVRPGVRMLAEMLHQPALRALQTKKPEARDELSVSRPMNWKLAGTPEHIHRV